MDNEDVVQIGTDVLPRRDLGAGDPWGRKMEQIVAQHANILDAYGLAIKGGNRTTAGQLGLIGEQLQELYEQQKDLKTQQDNLDFQQQDLIGRVSYAAAADANAVSFIASGTYPISGAGVTFTLNESRTVQAIATMTGYISSIIGPSSPIARLAVRRGSSLVGSVYARGVMSPVGRVGFQGSATTLALIRLPAGTHTITPAVEFTRQQAGDGFICNAASMTVNVLQKS